MIIGCSYRNIFLLWTRICLMQKVCLTVGSSLWLDSARYKKIQCLVKKAKKLMVIAELSSEYRESQNKNRSEEKPKPKLVSVTIHTCLPRYGV